MFSITLIVNAKTGSQVFPGVFASKEEAEAGLRRSLDLIVAKKLYGQLVLTGEKGLTALAFIKGEVVSRKCSFSIVLSVSIEIT